MLSSNIGTHEKQKIVYVNKVSKYSVSLCMLFYITVTVML